VLDLLKDYRLVVLGDREFCSVKLGHWLKEQRVNFCLRLRRDEYLQQQDGLWVELQALGLEPGHQVYLQGVNVTKQKGFGTFTVAAKWKRTYAGVRTEEAWFILTNLDSLKEAIAAYKQRFGIEEMFRDWKRGGYHLEGTGLSEERLLSLIVVLCLAYTSATVQGQAIKKKGVQKYVGRVSEPRRTTRRHSSFYIGLYAQNWVQQSSELQLIIDELMTLNLNKKRFYLAGLRARNLIRQAL
jgi:hypothetical protein